MLRYRCTIQNVSNPGQAQATHKRSGNLAMVRLLASLAGGLDHLFSLGNNPLVPFRDANIHTEALNTCRSGNSEINEDLDRHAVEQELRHYEEDRVSDTESLVAFWEVGIPIL